MADSKETYRTVTSYLLVSDADAELTFLKTAFGASEKSCHRNDAGAVMHAEITIGDSLVMLGQAGGKWKPLHGSLHLWVEDVDGTYQRALRAGAASVMEPVDQAYGHRSAGVADPNGVTWWIAAPVRESKGRDQPVGVS